ncbi:MAG: Asp-tRNA(Asn)/Glu-tRNA(Gln) amidotransferase subunit GatB [Armatimonadetes bacterium]|nr:Asp-tRNA(Asn)/Glu-tRNA(Gln) amidotransferase subunit GatB [Armatimonadota bacterium]
MNYEIVIGMEVHAELLTASKQFFASPNLALAEPNTLVDPVTLGLPGALPVLNEKAVDLSLRSVLALHCDISRHNFFERKHYFYPDLPKGYQISQRDKCLGFGGFLEIEMPDGSLKKIGMNDVHMEEDTGKSSHGEAVGDPDSSLIDLNRAGIPLLEIVSAPDMRSIEEADAYMTALREILLFLEISDCKMEQGRLRFEASVSLRPMGSEEFGTRVEIKNLNSMKAVRDSLRSEIARQTKVLDGGGTIRQETMLWDDASGTTQPMRSKEHAHDYRYMPEPDLAPLHITDEWLERIRAEMPELPRAKRARFETDLGLSKYDSEVLTQAPEIARYFESAAQGFGNAKAIANWVSNELLGRLNASGTSISETKVAPHQLQGIVRLIDEGTISGKIAKDVFDVMLESGKDAAQIVEEKGLKQMSDTGELETICRAVIEKSPKILEDYRAGKEKAFGAFVGGVMKETRGKANPALVNEILKKVLAEDAV